MTSPESSAGTAGVRLKKRPYHRHQPYLPKGLKSPEQTQSLAHERCLMILSVLSGHRSVSEAVTAGKLSRALYYQLEDKAVRAMMRSLDPLAKTSSTGAKELSDAYARIRALSTQLKLLTQRKRAAERLLRLVLKSNRAPVRMPRGRPPKTLARTTDPGADSP